MPDLSDVQTAVLGMFPSDLGDKVLNKLMIARTPPEMELPMIRALSTNALMMSDPEKDVNFAHIVITCSMLTGIGRDGMGRIDYAELIGAARDTKMAQDRLRYGE